MFRKLLSFWDPACFQGIGLREGDIFSLLNTHLEFPPQSFQNKLGFLEKMTLFLIFLWFFRFSNKAAIVVKPRSPVGSMAEKTLANCVGFFFMGKNISYYMPFLFLQSGHELVSLQIWQLDMF